MIKACLSYILLFIAISVQAQKIQYCRETFKMPYVDAMQLVANVNSYHHIVCFNVNKSPVVYRYDAQLQLLDKQEMPFKLKETSDVRIITFRRHYLLYVHPLNTTLHQLYKITGEGEVTPLSEAFQNFIDRELNKTASTLELINENEKLFVLAHTYYDGIKKIGTNVMQLDNDLNPVLGRKVLYDFKKDEDVLQQVMLTGNSLLVLKSSRNDEKGASLDMMKVDLTTGQSLINSFNSGSHLYTSPSFIYQPKDSSLILYSIIREPISNSRSQRTVFISHLDNQLHEAVPMNLFRSQFRGGVVSNFILMNGTNNWLGLRTNLRIPRYPRTPASQNFEMESNASTLNLSSRTRNTSLSSSSYFADNQPAGIRFTVVNEGLQLIKDSLITNDDKVFDVQPYPYAQFCINDKAHLFLVQNFSPSSRGIVVMSAGKEGQLITNDIPVFDKYNYLLDQLQTVSSSKYVLLPYTHKSDIGLLKISFD